VRNPVTVIVRATGSTRYAGFRVLDVLHDGRVDLGRVAVDRHLDRVARDDVRGRVALEAVAGTALRGPGVVELVVAVRVGDDVREADGPAGAVTDHDLERRVRVVADEVDEVAPVEDLERDAVRHGRLRGCRESRRCDDRRGPADDARARAPARAVRAEESVAMW
jgi:hypothetical protein